MKHLRKLALATAAGTVAALDIATTGSTHTPDATGSCNGISFRMTNAPKGYESGVKVTVDGKALLSKTYDGNFSDSVGVRDFQDTSEHDWKVVITGQYGDTYAGSFGPCVEQPTEEPTPSPTPTEPEETPSPSTTPSPEQPTTPPPASSTPQPTPSDSSPTPSSTPTAPSTEPTPTAPVPSETPSQPTTSTPSAPQKPVTPTEPERSIGTPEHQEIPDCKATEYWQSGKGCVPRITETEEGF